MILGGPPTEAIKGKELGDAGGATKGSCHWERDMGINGAWWSAWRGDQGACYWERDMGNT